jgi:hypothetical protein
VWAVLWYGLVFLAFGIAPSFPPSAAVGIGLAAVAGILLCLPGWTADRRWHRGHAFALVFGTMLGSMMAGFIGLLGAARADLYFKILVDLLAVALMLALGSKIMRSSKPGAEGGTQGGSGQASG